MRSLPLNILGIDLRVQRSLDTNRATKMSAELDLDAIGVLCVSHRADDTYWIIDGQHRRESLILAGFGADVVECEVFTGLSLAEEAAMFRLRNNTAKVSYLARFKVRLVEGDKDAIAVMDILTRHGWVLPGDKETLGNRLAAIQAFERIYTADRTSDPTAAERTLATLTAAWGHTTDAVEACLVEGLGLVYVRYGATVEADDLIRRLSKFGGGPGAFVGNARGIRDLIRVPLTRAAAELIVEIYNKSRRTMALPPWRAR